MREPVDFPRSSQFQHLQSFVLDLRVNQVIAERGFDMSVIAGHQAESICNLAEQCARGNPPKYNRVKAEVINAVAAALIELPRSWPDRQAGLNGAFEMIRYAMPDAFEAALGFVESVERHGLDDSDAIRRVVDDCATLSFTVTGNGIDLGNDLVEIPHTACPVDKQPEFLRQLPLSAKLEVFRKAANLGITGSADYRLHISPMRTATVTLTDLSGQLADSVQLSFRLPGPPPNMQRRPGAPNPLQSPGNSYVALPGLSAHGVPAGVAVSHGGFPSEPHLPQPVGFRPHSGTPNSIVPPPAGNPTGWPQSNWSDTFLRTGIPNTGGDSPAHAPTRVSNATPGQQSYRQPGFPPVQSGNQSHSQQAILDLLATEHAVYFGKDLIPRLQTTAAQETLPASANSGKGEFIRNYMAGFGRWISRVGFEEQALGEHPYGYAMTNPVTYVDPGGDVPRESPPRPIYDPGRWNIPGVEDNNNCYSYGCDAMAGRPGSPIPGRPSGFPPRFGFKPQPGGGVPNPCSCTSLIRSIRRGGLLTPRTGGVCPPGTFTVIAFVRTTSPCDFHFIRRDSNGLWSDKLGLSPVGSQFPDPYKRAEDCGYDTVCQHYCAPNRSTR